uniref:Inhibitor of growth protein N-terminal histone-binding domain-containing protein n=1 Tax=Quercus lobata TaxID=97700 RepID=A0A7N2M3I8_QUELO
MAIARTGVYVDDYLEYANTLPAELQRLLNTIRELDERSQSMMNQTRQQTKYCLGLASQSSKKGNNSNYINNNNNNNNSNNYNYSNYNNSNGNEEDDAAFEKMRKDIEVNQDNALSLCTEKVLLAQQAYDLQIHQMRKVAEILRSHSEILCITNAANEQYLA